MKQIKAKGVKTDGEGKGQYTDEEGKKLEMEQKNRLKIKKTRRGVEGGGDKQHRRKKMQVRHLVSPEAILKQDSAGVPLYQ